MSHDDSDFYMTDSQAVVGRPGSNQHPVRRMTHLALISAFLLPFTVVPYVLARRQIVTLRRQLAEAQTSVRVLEQEMKLSWQEMSSRQEEIQKTRGSVAKALQDGEQQRVLIERKDLEDLKFKSQVRSDLQKLLNDVHTTRSHGAMIGSLGTSLADIAAFMHEMELEMGMLSRGKDQRGIDRLRSLALRMQSEEHVEAKKPSTESNKRVDKNVIEDEADPY
ncbi:hypothetical protein H0H93_008392 [Arthromyces matolae]|nr:hypothetical protein H0H93_008392 [Arthromyces matolae]